MMQILMEQMDALICQNFKSMWQPKGDEKPLIPDTSVSHLAITRTLEFDTYRYCLIGHSKSIDYGTK